MVRLKMCQLLTLFLSQVAKLLRHSALLKECLHFLHVLCLHVVGVRRVLSLQEDSEKFEHGLLDGECGVLQSLLTDLAEALGHDGSESLLKESDRVLFLLEVVEGHGFLLGRNLDRKLCLGIAAGLGDELL